MLLYYTKSESEVDVPPSRSVGNFGHASYSRTPGLSDFSIAILIIIQLIIDIILYKNEYIDLEVDNELSAFIFFNVVYLFILYILKSKVYVTYWGCGPES